MNHSGVFPSVTISFNLPPGGALGDAVDQIDAKIHELGLPSSLHGRFQGAALAFQDSLKNEPILIAAALATVYIVLGILYESYMHPITILSTLPSAGVGALLALLLTGNELNVMGLIGILLLIGIVKKNAIMMIDFALEAERKENMSSVEAIYTACVLRFRPIMMTTLAALFGGLALGAGHGRRLRAAPAAGNCHRGRPAREPGPHALHDARHLSLSRPLPPVGARARQRPGRSGHSNTAGPNAARHGCIVIPTICIFLEVIVKNLTRRKTRTVLTAAGLAAAVAATTTLLNIAWAFAGSAADSYKSRNVDIVVVRAGVAERITSSLSAPLAARLAALPEVADVDGSLTEMVSFGAADARRHSASRIGSRGLCRRKTDDRLRPAGSRRKIDTRSFWEADWLAALGKRAGRIGRDRRDAVPDRGRLSDRQRARVEHGRRAAGRRAGTDGPPGTGFRVPATRGAGRRQRRGHSPALPANRVVCATKRAAPSGSRRCPRGQFVDSDTETRLATAMAWGTSIITVDSVAASACSTRC